MRRRTALGDGSLTQERYDAWRKLQRELRALERRRDARARSEHRREIKRFSKDLRRHYKEGA